MRTSESTRSGTRSATRTSASDASAATRTSPPGVHSATASAREVRIATSSSTIRTVRASGEVMPEAVVATNRTPDVLPPCADEFRQIVRDDAALRRIVGRHEHVLSVGREGEQPHPPGRGMWRAMLPSIGTWYNSSCQSLQLAAPTAMKERLSGSHCTGHTSHPIGSPRTSERLAIERRDCPLWLVLSRLGRRPSRVRPTCRRASRCRTTWTSANTRRASPTYAVRRWESGRPATFPYPYRVRRSLRRSPRANR